MSMIPVFLDSPSTSTVLSPEKQCKLLGEKLVVGVLLFVIVAGGGVELIVGEATGEAAFAVTFPLTTHRNEKSVPAPKLQTAFPHAASAEDTKLRVPPLSVRAESKMKDSFGFPSWLLPLLSGTISRNEAEAKDRGSPYVFPVILGPDVVEMAIWLYSSFSASYKNDPCADPPSSKETSLRNHSTGTAALFGSKCKKIRNAIFMVCETEAKTTSEKEILDEIQLMQKLESAK
jgi:hypothetical protein